MNKEEFANLIKGLRKYSHSPPNMKPEPSRKMSVSDNLRIIGTLTTRSIKPGRTPKAQTYNSFGTTETHRVTVIELKPEDRATLQSMAKRYRVKSLTRFLEGCLSAGKRTRELKFSSGFTRIEARNALP